MPPSLHQLTPTLTMLDPRRLQVATVAYHRVKPDDPFQVLTERQAYDAAGRARAQWDARSWAQGGETGLASRRKIHSLSGQIVGLESADAGWRAHLFGTGAQTLENWDGRGTYRQTTFDPRLRPVTVREHLVADVPACVERFTYGTPADTGNRCGRLIRHDDPAGSQVFIDYGLSGQIATQTQHFLDVLASPNWPALLHERDVLLGEERPYLTRWRHDALAVVISQTDAMGNEQLSRYNVAGQLATSSLIPDGESEQVLVSSIVYNASGQTECLKYGNGITSQATYATEDGRLSCLIASRPDQTLQALHFVRDPVGNVLSLEDRAQPTQWFDGQRIDPVSTFRYDTLNQLIEATGRESVLATMQPGLPELVMPGMGDASRLRNYRQNYTYDAAGNLLTLKHSDAPLRVMKVAPNSNRSLYIEDPSNPPNLEKAFDQNGNLLALHGAQTMVWDARNQLQRVTQIERTGTVNDDEVYVYHGDGQRSRKVRVQQAKAVQQVEQVLYLPGLEIRRNSATGEELHVMTMGVGRSRVRRLKWRANGRAALPAAQSRFSIDDHLGSCALELDETGEVISHEGYYPFGGSAWWAAKSQTHAAGKTIRYSGKERDATGLYYYGLRYYAPWLSRWINPDPAGDIDGLNLYRMVRNNPLRFRDGDGREPDEFLEFVDDFSGANDPGFPQNPETFRRRDLSVKNASARQQDIEREFKHALEGKHTILSSYKNHSGTYRFENEFLPGRWRLMENYRAPDTQINATDVTFEQYEQISRKNDFYGVLPRVIVRWDVKDELVTAIDGDSEGMLERFLASKNNGRSTQRIMDAFGLRATGIELVIGRDSQRQVDVNAIAISVEPIPNNSRMSMETLTRETERDLRRMNRNPVSRVAHGVWRNIKRAILPTDSRRALR